MIFYIDEYYDDIYDLLEMLTDYEPDEKALEILRENYPNGVTVQECKEIPVYQFTEDDFWQIMDGKGDWPEESTMTEEQTTKAIKKHLPALNADMPTVWMPTKEKTEYSLKELEEMI